MTKYTKPPTAIQQQIQILKNKGLSISNESHASNFLQHVAYYRIRAYWIIYEKLDEDGNHTGKIQANIDFLDIINLYDFDTSLRNLILQQVEIIEISLRNTFINLANKYNTSHFHLNQNFFQNSEKYDKSMLRLTESLKHNKDEMFIAHYYKKYTNPAYPPIWSITEILTIGELSHWIKNLHDSTLDQLAKTYGFANRVIFISFLERLVIIRNICAHHSRLWNRIIHKKQLKLIKQSNELSDALNTISSSISTFYGTFVYTIYILNQISTYHSNTLLSNFNSLIIKHNIDISLMGFPSNWKELAIMQQK